MDGRKYSFPVLKASPRYAEMLLSGIKKWEFRKHVLPTNTAMLIHDGADFVGLVTFDFFVHSDLPFVAWDATNALLDAGRNGGIPSETCEEHGWKYAMHVRKCAACDLPIILNARLPRVSGRDAIFELPGGGDPFARAIHRLYAGGE